MLNGPAGKRFKKTSGFGECASLYGVVRVNSQKTDMYKYGRLFKNIRIRVDVHSKATSISSENKFLKPKMKT